MQNPLVSILIPFKNTEKYLVECLQSIVEQKYQNWEVWAVNDHSKDASLEIAEGFAEKDQRIHVIENKGNGIIEALRLAYSRSKGEFITRMDADDIMVSIRLTAMIDSLMDHGKGHIALGQVKYFSDRGLSNGYQRYEIWLNNLTRTGNNFKEIYKECVIPSPCWMVHRHDFDASGAFEPNRYPEDYDLAFRFYENTLKCIPSDQVLHHWRDYDSRTSRTSEHYAQNYFLDIKIHYFLKLDYHKNRPLVLWGAGNKGKTIAKSLIEKQIDFVWLCDNPKKIGKDIYGKKMLHYTHLTNLKNAQTIITVANEEEQTEIRAYLFKLNRTQIHDYFFFC